MPVILEQVSQASPQDLIDLEKIYLDYPSELRWSDVQAKLHKDSSLSLYAGRFNDRLLGAVLVRAKDNKLLLEDFCVRAITRQRFVARDILRLLLEQETTKTIESTLCQPSPGMDKLLSNAGFSRQGQTYTLQQGN